LLQDADDVQIRFVRNAIPLPARGLARRILPQDAYREVLTCRSVRCHVYRRYAITGACCSLTTFFFARDFQTSSITSAPTNPYSRGRGGISDVSTSSYDSTGSLWPLKLAIVVLSHLRFFSSNLSHQVSAWRRRSAGSSDVR